jgi:hypothetical protein
MNDTPTYGDRYALRRWPQEGLRQRAKGRLGLIAMRCFPARAARLREEYFTHHGRRTRLLDRLIGCGIAYQALRRGDLGNLAEYHRRFWAGSNTQAFHDSAEERFKAAFLTFYTPVIDALEQFLDDRGEMTTFCEVGAGVGLLLDYLAKRFDRVERLIGIDLSEATIQQNRETFSDPRMEFVAGDALEFIETHGQPNWVYLTHNGVLEYLQPETVDRYFALIAEWGPAAVVLIEPIGLNHDLDTQPESWPYGQEFSISHNYPYRLRQAGFDIQYQDEANVYGVRVILILATIGVAARESTAENAKNA